LRLALPLEKLIEHLALLPGIGPKTAQRLALYILKYPRANAEALAQSIINLREHVFPCEICGFLTDVQPCSICRDSERDPSILCLLEESTNVIAIERSGFKGRYYVLNQHFQLLGSNLSEIDLNKLKTILSGGAVKEVIMALSPDIEGDILARYLAAAISEFKYLKLTRLAHGLPVGGDIEFTDDITLRKAIEGRKEF
jgi:recombination protein RecR